MLSACNMSNSIDSQAIEILKAKLASEGINSYLKNEYVNNVVVMPINQDYFLLVSDEDFEKAKEIINNQQDIIEE